MFRGDELPEVNTTRGLFRAIAEGKPFRARIEVIDGVTVLGGSINSREAARSSSRMNDPTTIEGVFGAVSYPSGLVPKLMGFQEGDDYCLNIFSIKERVDPEGIEHDIYGAAGGYVHLANPYPFYLEVPVIGSDRIFFVKRV